MNSNGVFCREQEVACVREADASDLPAVREQRLAAARAWAKLAERAERQLAGRLARAAS